MGLENYLFIFYIIKDMFSCLFNAFERTYPLIKKLILYKKKSVKRTNNNFLLYLFTQEVLSSSRNWQFTAHKTVKLGDSDNSLVKINTENATGNKSGQFSLHKPCIQPNMSSINMMTFSSISKIIPLKADIQAILSFKRKGRLKQINLLLRSKAPENQLKTYGDESIIYP
jgi:hypothetical protein